MRQANHRARVDELAAPGGNVRARRNDTGRDRRIQRKDLILLRFRNELLPHFGDLVRVFRRDVRGLVEVVAQVIELEDLIVQRIGIGRAEGLPWCAIDLGAQQPAIVVERPLPHHLEVLGLVPGCRLGVLRIERVGEARALDRRLLDAVHHVRRIDARDLENGRHHVDDVDELLAQTAFVLDARRPRHDHVLVDAAEPARHSA